MNDILYNPDTLAHFTTIETAVTKIIHTRKLRFSSYLKSYDQLESSSLNISISNWLNPSESIEDQDNKIQAVRESQEDVVTSMLNNIKIFCFCMNKTDIQDKRDYL